MTIREAVEKYQYINDEIVNVKNFIKSIFAQDTGPLKQYHLNESEMTRIAFYMERYIDQLENELDKELE